MRAGKLRHRVTIQRQVHAKDEQGNPSVTWEDFAEGVPAELVPLSGRELIAAQATQSEIVARCTIRWMEGVTSAMRISFGGAVYNIAAPPLADPTFQRHLTLMLSGGLTDGR